MMISQYFTLADSASFALHGATTKIPLAHEQAARVQRVVRVNALETKSRHAVKRGGSLRKLILLFSAALVLG
jgi:hypothetical protein